MHVLPVKFSRSFSSKDDSVSSSPSSNVSLSEFWFPRAWLLMDCLPLRTSSSEAGGRRGLLLNLYLIHYSHTIKCSVQPRSILLFVNAARSFDIVHCRGLFYMKPRTDMSFVTFYFQSAPNGKRKQTKRRNSCSPKWAINFFSYSMNSDFLWCSEK